MTVNEGRKRGMIRINWNEGLLMKRERLKIQALGEGG